MRNLHNILLQEDGIEARRLFRLWEKLRIRASKYKNHRIFTLRCLHNDLIPVSIKLKSTLKSTRAKKILRKAEKDLLQARIKTINFTLDNTSKQLEECRSKLVAIISTQRLRECQDFVDKVSEIRFNKVKQRQLNKFNLLTIRKEGNITRSITNLNNHNHNLNSQTNSQVNLIPQASPPSGEDNRSSQAGPPTGKLALPHPPHRPTVRLGKEALLPRLALPLPGKTAVFPRLPPPPSPQLVPPRLVLPPPREDSSLFQATTSSLSQASAPQTGTTPPREDSSLPLASTSSLSQASALQAGAIPPGEDNSLSQVTTSSPSQASALLPSSEGSRPPNPPGTQAGLASNKNNTIRQGSRCPPRHRPTQASPGGQHHLPGRQQLHPPH